MNKKLFLTTLMASSMALLAGARSAEGLTVYINPGHGGHESDDRNVVIAPYAQGDPNGYWESNSNLSKGLQLRDMLQAKGYKVVMSRVTNTSDDDLALSTIVNLANNSKADIFFSIHSNATGTSSRVNFPLMLFRGYDNEPVKPADVDVCKILNKHLLENKITYWTNSNTNVRGDWSFYHSWGTQGLGVLRGLQITGMLSEGSFHDYIPEAYRLMSDEYCYLEAWHFRKAIDEYFGVDGETTGLVCGRLNDSRVPREGSYIIMGTDKLATVQNATVELVDASGNVVDTYKTHGIHINGVYMFKNVAPGTYTVRAKAETHLPVQQTIEVAADQVTYCNMAMDMVRTSAPEVESYSPLWTQGDEPVLCNSPVIIQFNWDMDTKSAEDAFSISPEVPGSFSWEDVNHRMVFTPSEAYDINTTYTVTISKSAMHGGGVPMEKDFSFSFLTSNRNFMTVLSSFPIDGENVHFNNAFIEFRFDKLPNCSNLLQQVTCVDSKGNSVAFNKRKLTNSKVGSPYGFFRIPFSSDLTVGESYTITVDGSLADKDGLTIPETVTVKFTATDEGQPKPGIEVLEDMDTPSQFVYDTESSAEVASASVAAYNNPLFEKATGFTYKFNGTEGGEILFGKTQETTASESALDLTIQPGQALGAHVMGDLSGNEVYLQVTTEMSVQYVPVCTMNFLGWRYVNFPASLESPGIITGIKLVQTPSQASGSGTFALDNILRSTTGGVDEIELTSLTLHPNPASEYLVANAGVTISSVTLYGMNGIVAASTSGNVLNVSELPDGNYICVVSTASGSSSRRVVIKH